VTARARLAAVLAVIALTALGRSARAADAFEIQVYDGKANAPGQAGLEAHLNYVARGVMVAEAPELPPNHQAHFTLEPSYGVRETWEVGAYFMTAARADGTFDVVGGKLRSKHVTPLGWAPHARLGLNVEVSYARATYEAEQWGIEVRPIAAWDSPHFRVAFNPIVGVSLRGGAPSFAPAALAVIPLRGIVSLGLEYYGDLGSVVAPLPVAAQSHTLYEVANLLCVADFELNVGIGEGLTASSNALTAKVILGRAF
jgi:hypothetical protein